MRGFMISLTSVMAGLTLISCMLSLDLPSISKEALRAQLNSATAPVIIDVRSAAEFRKGHIPNAIHVPFFKVSSYLDTLPSNPTQPVVVYCTRGLRAMIARAALRRAGFEQILYLDGQFATWRREQFPIVTSR